MISTKYIFSIAILFLLASCVKKDPISYSAQVSFAPLSGNATALDFYLNTSFQARGVNYSTIVGTTNYSIPYFISDIGNVVLKYTPTGVVAPIVSKNVLLEDGKAYSSFIIDSIAKAKIAVVEDDLSAPEGGKVKFRFFHFSGNTVPVDVYIQGVATPIYTNRTFNDQETAKDFQGFKEVTAGTYVFEVRQAGTATVLTTFSSLVFQPDRIYTLALRGFTGGTGNRAVSGWWFTNKR